MSESGILVPFIVAGPGVRAPGRVSEALVDVTDIFATVADWTGAKLSSVALAGPLDSVSLAPYLADPESEPPRRTAFAECFRPNGFGPYTLVRRAVRDERYKLVHLERDDGRPVTHLFDLEADPDETRDLLRLEPESPEVVAARDRLTARLEALSRSK